MVEALLCFGSALLRLVLEAWNYQRNDEKRRLIRYFRVKCVIYCPKTKFEVKIFGLKAGQPPKA